MMNKLFFLLLLFNVKILISSEVQELFNKAITESDTKQVIELLKQHNDINVNVKNDHGKTPIIHAIENNSSELVNILINNNADVNILDDYEQTPIIYAIKANSPELVNLLINKANINFKDDYDQTPLIHTIKQNSLDLATLLLLNSPKPILINATDLQGNTALIYAVLNNNVQLTKLLMDYNADINVKNQAGKTALDEAFKYLQIHVDDDNIKQIIYLLLTKYYKQYKKNLKKIQKKLYKRLTLPVVLNEIISEYKLGFIEYLEIQLGKELPKNYLEFINNNFLATLNKRKSPRDQEQELEDDHPAKKIKLEDKKIKMEDDE